MTVTAAGFKRRAEEQAASLVQSGMVVGLGAASTATVAICRIPPPAPHCRIQRRPGHRHVARHRERRPRAGHVQQLSPELSTYWPLPVKVTESGWRSQARFLDDLRTSVTPRTGNGGAYRADQSNTDPASLAVVLEARAGIVGHGSFLTIASDVIVAGEAEPSHFMRVLDPVLTD